jgi:hypothetical protein
MIRFRRNDVNAILKEGHSEKKDLGIQIQGANR